MASGLRLIQGAEIELSDLTGGIRPPPPESEPGIPVLSPTQLGVRAKAIRWVVKRAVQADAIGVLFGAWGSFKSFIALDLALHVAHGLHWLGRKTVRGPVVYLAAEGGAGLYKRMLAWHKRRGLDMADAQIYVIPIGVDLRNDAALVSQAVNALGLGMCPALVVIDTLAQTLSGEENSSTDVSAYLREIGLWFRNAWGSSVLLVHHTGHSAPDRSRGSSALGANPDYVFAVLRDGEEMLATVENHKQKEDERIAPVTFSLHVVELGQDDDGEPITSCAAEAVIGNAEVLAHMDHEAKRGRGGNNKLFLDLAVNGIEEKKLKTIYFESIEGDGEKKRKAYFRARKWAVSNGIIEIAQGYVLRLGD